jgi:drug/metabolite transporter (DMT)-like permease
VLRCPPRERVSAWGGPALKPLHLRVPLRALAAGALLLNAFTWGVSWWPFRQLKDLGVHPLWVTALIYLVAWCCLTIARPTAWRGVVHNPGLWVLMLSSGLTNVGFNWAVTVGDVVRVVLLFYLMPAWTVLLAWPILGVKPSAGSLSRLALALVGVVVVLKTPESAWPWPHSLADGLALMGGFAFALTNVMLLRLRKLPTDASMLAMFGGGALMASLTAWGGMQWGLVDAVPALAPTWLAWVAGLSLLILVGNFGLQYGAKRLSASATSIIMLSEVVFASTSAVLLGAGTLTNRVLIGGAFILLAALLSSVSFGNNADNADRPHG